MDDGIKFEKDLASADLVLAFNLTDDFKVPSFRGSEIKRHAGDKTKFITNLFFSGYHPDFCYINDTDGKRLQSVLGDYHSKISVVGCMLEKKTSRIVEALLDTGFGDEVGYREIFSTSLDELNNRDQKTDLGYAKRLSSIVYDDTHFLTFNHPRNQIYYDYISRIIKNLGLPHTRLYFNQMELHGGGPILPVHPCINSLISSQNTLRNRTYAKPANATSFMTTSEFVEACQVIYKQLDGANKNRIMNMPWAGNIAAAFGVG